jgi:hypothetical protein
MLFAMAAVFDLLDVGGVHWHCFRHDDRCGV